MIVGEGAVAFVENNRAGDRLLLNHTEVPEVLSGQGIGSKLVRGTLDRLRAAGLKVVSRCSFAVTFIGRHSEYRDLLAESG